MQTVPASRPKGQRQPRPPRTLKLLARPDAGGPGLLALTVNGVRQVYWVSAIDSALGGRCFELRKFRSADAYHVRLAHDGHTCDCPAGTFRGQCKHQDALAALTARGVL
jgi:hypothetical protein